MAVTAHSDDFNLGGGCVSKRYTHQCVARTLDREYQLSIQSGMAPLITHQQNAAEIYLKIPVFSDVSIRCIPVFFCRENIKPKYKRQA